MAPRDEMYRRLGVRHEDRRAASSPPLAYAAFAAYIACMTIGTRLFTYFRGRIVGTDGVGNRYFVERKARAGKRVRRWVLYNGAAEASTVPPEWHSWLHYTTDDPLPETGRKPWQKPHMPNLTGTPQSYRPPGHDYMGGKRAAASGDYEAWTPGG